jgi:hypothetical protein
VYYLNITGRVHPKIHTAIPEIMDPLFKDRFFSSEVVVLYTRSNIFGLAGAGEFVG